MLEVVTGLLARHELYVARFYLDRDNFDAAVARCEYALTNYSGLGLEPEALVLLGETYLKMKETEKARVVLPARARQVPGRARSSFRRSAFSSESTRPERARLSALPSRPRRLISGSP